MTNPCTCYGGVRGLFCQARKHTVDQSFIEAMAETDPDAIENFKAAFTAPGVDAEIVEVEIP